MDKARETIAGIAEEGIYNVHDMDVTLRGYAEGATDAILASLPEIIRQNPSIIADMVEPLEWEKLWENTYRANVTGELNLRVETYGHKWVSLWSVPGYCATFADGDHATSEAAIEATNAKVIATILKALSMKEGE